MKTESTLQLQSTFSRLSDAWFPTDPQLLEKIKHEFSPHIAETSDLTDALLQEIKCDVSLLTFCMKELTRLSNIEGKSPFSLKNPLDALRQIGYQKLRTLVDVEDGDISFHSFSEAKKPQADQIRKSLIAGIVSESIAPEYEVDPELSFSCSILRQLGLTLIAWNYPHIYSRALFSSEHLDTFLSRNLGFSPTLLAVVVAKRWGCSPEVMRGVGDLSVNVATDSPESVRIGETLEKVCQIGETFAQIAEPSTEGQSALDSDWEKARAEITRVLGESGFKQLEEKIAESCQHYYEYAPSLFPVTFSTPESHSERLQQEFVPNANPFIASCPPDIKSKIEKIYAKLEPSFISKENIDTLLTEIIPQAGFPIGCVYLVEPDLGTLVPRLLIGDIPKDYFSAVNYRDKSYEEHPVARAFLCSTPISGEFHYKGEKSVYYMAGSIGIVHRAGVLYLELSNELRNAASAEKMVIYKAVTQAIRQTLNDCLGLK